MKILFFRETECRDLNPILASKIGMGATETCVISLAEELAKTNEIKVVCPCTAGFYEKVEYINFKSYLEILIILEFWKPDVFIVVGNPSIIFQHLKNIKSKIIFWQHNHPLEMLRFNMKILFENNIRVVLPSIEAADNASDLYKYKTHGIYNGVRKVFFNTSEKKIKNKIAYSGSFIRTKGLYELLKVAHKIPECSINLCGSFNMYGYEDTEYKNGCELLINQKNINILGALGPQFLAKELSSAELVICNPQANKETCCVSALEAMACGTAVLSSENSIIAPIIKKGGKTFTNNHLDLEIKALMTEDTKIKLAESGKNFVSNLSWDKISLQWIEYFNL